MKTKFHSISIWFVYMVFFSLLVAAGVKILKPIVKPAAQAQVTQPPANNPVPILAYFYIWYNSTSWERAKTDIPLLGKYSSDDLAVMRQQIQDAKAAGIDGFIVSWKSTDVLNRRLKQLAQVAEEENFKLAIIYQGLDFYRNPLPVDQVGSDMDVFIQQYASLPAFQLFSKPLVIWSGTWKFNTEEIAQVTTGRREKLLLLASERNLEGYNRLVDLVDGEAYYWSSANPETYPGYPNKLIEMGKAVHDNNGLWIAPAAPGFNAQLVGGTSDVDRKDGETFRTEINGAMQSSPDALGIISWNEYSENSHIEPSQKYGTQYLDILSQIKATLVPNVVEFDSSIPDKVIADPVKGSRIIALSGFTGLLVLSIIIIVLRR